MFSLKMIYEVSRDTLTHPQKTWICQKFCVLFFSSLRQDGMIELIRTNFCQFFFFFGGGGDKERVPGRINANLRSKIRDANNCNVVTNIAQVSPHTAQDAFSK